MTKLERRLRHRERQALNAINRETSDLYNEALRVLFWLCLFLTGMVFGLFVSASRVQASTKASIPPRCEYVGAIPETPVSASQPPTAANETAIATMPDAVMVERVGEKWKSLGVWMTTGYCPCHKCNGRNAGRTASGAPMIPGRTLAVAGLPFGTELKINGHIYVVEDRGTPYGHADILYGDHYTAGCHSVQHAEVFIRIGAE